jgi:hypothetical protein
MPRSCFKSPKLLGCPTNFWHDVDHASHNTTRLVCSFFYLLFTPPCQLMAGRRLKMCDSRRWVYIHASCIVLESGFGNQYYSMQGIEKKWL